MSNKPKGFADLYETEKELQKNPNSRIVGNKERKITSNKVILQTFSFKGDPEKMKQLKLLAVNMGRKVQEILDEAIADLLKKYNKGK